MGGIKDLFDNEKGVLAVIILIGATVLAIVGKMSMDEWKTLTMWIFGLYAGATAVRRGMESLGGLPTARTIREAKARDAAEAKKTETKAVETKESK